jgi:hypothetical protein
VAERRIGRRTYARLIEAAPPPLEPEAIPALVRLLPVLESPAFSPGQWRGGEANEEGVIQMPWFEPSDKAQAVLDEVRRGGWLFAYDWQAWQDEARALIESDALEGADIDTLRRLLTLLVRSDRFMEGQLAWAFESGLMARIVRRVAVISGG